MEKNYLESKKKWNNQKIIKNYCKKLHIQDGEKKILSIIKNNFNTDNIKSNSMLDIGVGGGRTTYHFNKLFKNYLGIDIADDYYKHLYEKYPNCNFEIQNILTFNTEKKYNFILFSHNGIDYMINIKDYLDVIKKLYDFCENGGYIAFSSHNALFKNIKKDYEIISENVCNVNNIFTFYTNPYFIYNHLKKFNFTEIKIIDRNGNEIFLDDFNNNWNDNQYIWLYYLCKK